MKSIGLQVNIAKEEDTWANLVKSFRDYEVYYLLDYAKAFKIHGDGEPLLFYYENSNFRAINVVMKRDIANSDLFFGKIPCNEYYDFVTPYGYGGFLIEGDPTSHDLRKLNDEYVNHCKTNGVISEFVRFNPIRKNNLKLDELYKIIELGPTVTMELQSPEKIWGNMYGKNRNMIRKAIKSDVKIYWGRNEELNKDFRLLYNSTMDKDNADKYYYFNDEFYSSVIDDLKYNSLYFFAEYNNEIIAMAIILFANKVMHYHLSASNIKYQYLAPNNLLLYEVARWGCENGFKKLHLGGGLGGKEDSLYKFKKVFSKDSNTTFSIGKKIFIEEKYNELLEIREKHDENFQKQTSFFPAYRA